MTKFVPRILLHCRTHALSSTEVCQKEWKQGCSNSTPGLKHQASIRRKSFFIGKVTSGSSQQLRLVSDWLAAVDLAASMDELDHSGFVFDKQVVKFQTLDKKITNGSRKTLLTDLERESSIFRRRHKTKKAPNSCRQGDCVPDLRHQ